MKILILASNPRGDLKLGKEIRNLGKAIRQSDHSKQCQVVVELEVQIGSLQELMDTYQPDIVHFCGHGDGEQGLVFQNDNDQEQLVPTEALSELFKKCKDDVKCVVLNACYSEVQAKAIVEHIDYVIGMRQDVLDQTAIDFSESFYREIGNGKSIKDAYQSGRLQISLKSGRQPSLQPRKATVVNSEEELPIIPEHLQPIIIEKNPNAKFKQFSFARHSDTEPMPQRSSNQQQVLSDVKEEVSARLKQSLHYSIPIPLSKEERPDQVTRWNTQVKIGHKPSKRLMDEITLVDVFSREDIGGKLLILGSPGSGKTTAMLDLAKDLLGRAAQDSCYPIPVLLSLSSWKEVKQSIPDWLVKELHLKYGIAPEISQQWLKDRQLLPMLDGLDEVESSKQAPCIQQINQWLHSDVRPLHLIVCSRIDEYQAQETKLALNGAIYLHSFTDKQVQTYLTKQVDHPDLWFTLNQDPELMQLVRTPLMLSILTLAYNEISIERWKNLQTTDDRCEYLLDAYIRRMLDREVGSEVSHVKKLPSPQQTRRWLIWLSKQLEDQFQDEFLIEQMQPLLLRSKTQQWQYSAIVGLILGTIDGLIFALLMTPMVGLIVGVSVGLALFADQSLGAGGISKIETVESFQFSALKVFQEVRKSTKQALIFGGGLGLAIGIISVLLGQSVAGFGTSLAWGIGFGLLNGFTFGAINGLKADIETRKYPNQGIWNSAKNIGILTLIVYPAGIFLDYCFSLIFRQEVTWIASIFRGLGWALIFGLGTSGKACIQHFVLRSILYRKQSIPWNYARFLQTCTERSLLQQVGGRFRFIHKQLQEHFADMPFNP